MCNIINRPVYRRITNILSNSAASERVHGFAINSVRTAIALGEVQKKIGEKCKNL